MKDRTCKDCVHYDDTPGIPGRCKIESALRGKKGV